MVARSPGADGKRPTPAANSAARSAAAVRETLKKVDSCVARLQELQYTVAGGAKIVAGGVTLSPRSTRGYLRTSLRCKQETVRMKAAGGRNSPAGKFGCNGEGQSWRTSLPAMLIGETVVEILQASQFARDIVSAAGAVIGGEPRTPCTVKKAVVIDASPLVVRRAREKKGTARAAAPSPCGRARARARIQFKSSSPLGNAAGGSARPSVSVSRFSPKSRPWAKKTVLFPNPAFQASSPTAVSKVRFYKTRSPIIGRAAGAVTPHKFLIRTPGKSLGAQLKRHGDAVSPVRNTAAGSPAAAAKTRRCSFSPSRLVTRLASPIRTRLSLHRSRDAPPALSGLKQRPAAASARVRVC